MKNITEEELVNFFEKEELAKVLTQIIELVLSEESPTGKITSEHCLREIETIVGKLQGKIAIRERG